MVSSSPASVTLCLIFRCVRKGDISHDMYCSLVVTIHISDTQAADGVSVVSVHACGEPRQGLAHPLRVPHGFSMAAVRIGT